LEVFGDQTAFDNAARTRPAGKPGDVPRRRPSLAVGPGTARPGRGTRARALDFVAKRQV